MQSIDQKPSEESERGFQNSSGVTLDEIFVDGVKSEPIIEPDSEVIVLLNALPLSIGLLPNESNISLNMIKINQEIEGYSDVFENIGTIKHLIDFIRFIGQHNFQDFQFTLIDSDAGVWHNEKNELIVVGVNELEKSAFADRIKSLTHAEEI
jgi:hypothetical protein